MSLATEWFSAPEVAALALPDTPTTTANVRAMADREGWRRPEWYGRRWRKREGRGGGFEYHWSLLPPGARLVWSVTHAVVDTSDEHAAAIEGETADRGLWEWFLQLPDKRRDEAARRLQVLEQVRAIVRETSRPKVAVVEEVAAAFEIKKSTLYNWENLVRGRPRIDWLPLLAPRHAGRTAGADITPEAWDALYVEYMRPAAPNFTTCYRKIARAAKENGWTLPSCSTLRRRMEQMPRELHVLNRQGAEALKRVFPAQERDRSVFHALEAVNADGHKWDVFVQWPDGYVGRPMMVGFQDLYSGVFLSWRIDRTENKDLIRLAFGDMVEKYGLPRTCYLDNGRGFASKSLTGGIKNRFRFKYREEEPDGIMTQLGVQVHWTLPYSGQSKPIERGFGDLARDVARDIRFEGAYAGNSPVNKPDNYGQRAVPLDVFLRVVEEGITEHNTRTGRRSQVCGGRLSFQQAFDESYAKSAITKVTAAQRQLWLLAAEGVRAQRGDGAVLLMGNRYWGDFLPQMAGKSLTVRFDPDRLHEPLHIYRPDGLYLGAAPCVQAVGFNNTDAARDHARRRTAFIRATKSIDEAQRRMSVEQQIALTTTETEAPPAPETKVVRLFAQGTAALAASAAPDWDARAEETEELLMKAAADRRAHRLRLVGAGE